MQVYNMHDAKTHLSRLVERAAQGESFVIAKGGKPMVKVVPIDAPEPAQARRLGFLAGQLQIPNDFNTMGRDEIETLFGSAG